MIAAMWAAVRAVFQRRPKERRQYPRIKWEIPITVQTKAGQKLQGTTRDYAVDGVGALLPADLALDAEVMVTIQLPDGSPPRRTRAIVRRREGKCHGLDFLD